MHEYTSLIDQKRRYREFFKNEGERIKVLGCRKEYIKNVGKRQGKCSEKLEKGRENVGKIAEKALEI